MMDEEQTRNAVMMEDLDRNLRLLAEAITAQDERWAGRMRTFDQRLDQFGAEVAGIAVGIGEIKTKVDKLEGKVDKLEGKVDKLEGKVDKLEAKVDKLEAKVDNVEAFAIDAKPRLERIETHLGLNAPLPRPTPKRPALSKHHRRKSTKRT